MSANRKIFRKSFKAGLDGDVRLGMDLSEGNEARIVVVQDLPELSEVSGLAKVPSLQGRALGAQICLTSLRHACLPS